MPRYGTKLKSKQQPKGSLMPLLFALFGLSLILIAGWAFLGSGQTKVNIEVKGAPRLKVDKEKVDHGDVKLGNTIVDTIRVTNVGDQPLRFTEAPYLEVKEGC